MEFVPRPNLPEGLAALVAQLQARQGPSLAAGITSAVDSISRGFSDRFDAKAKIAAAAKDATAKAIASGQQNTSELARALIAQGFAPAGGGVADIQGILSGKVPLFAPKPKENKAMVEVTPELAKKYKGLIVGSLVPATHMSTLEQKETIVSDKKKEAEGKAASAREAAKIQATDVIGAAQKALNSIGFFTTGIPGSLMSMKPGSDRKALEGYIATLRANLSFDKLQELRNNSKTGGALGNVSDTEIKLLSSSAAALDPDQPDDVLKENITTIQSKYEALLKKLNGGGAESPKADATPKPAPKATPKAAPVFTPEMAARKAELEAKIAAKRAPK